jgi:hypothetical protein
MKELEVKEMLEDSRIPEQYKRGGRLSSEFLDGVDFAEQRIMEKGVEVWLARNKNGKIFAHLAKPSRLVKFFVSSQNIMYLGDDKDNVFPEVTFENSPKKARIILED